MIDDLKAIAIFAEMAKQGSFRGAAKMLGLSPSVVSYHVGQLEQRVGTALIYRSTRKLSLTHEGQVLYEHAKAMIDAAETGLSEIAGETAKPKGKLTVTLPSLVARGPLNMRIAEFCKRYPGITLNLIYTDTRQDLIANGIDLAIRAGNMPDSSLKSRRIGEIERKLVCSAEYYESREAPRTPKDLEGWDWIRLSMLSPSRVLIGPKGERVPVEFESRVFVDAVEASTQFAILGIGLATPPSFLIEEELGTGILIDPLPEWQVEPIPIYAVWPQNASMNNNLKLLLADLTDSKDD